MACGTPTISTYNSSLPEAVGDAAMHVDAHDIAQIANAMERLLTDEKLRADYIEKGYVHIRKFNTREIAINFIRSIEAANK
jgi:glycosyltransferase involved in cell wall biosynthesis